MKSFKKIFGILLLVIALVATAALITGCGSGGIAKKPADLDAASIEYDGSTISWNYAENAVKYKVKINGEETETEFTSIAFSTSENTVQVTITPVGKKDKEGKSGSATFNRLDQITEIRFDENGVASWDAVTGATAYIVEVNGKTEKITSLTYSNFERGKQNSIRVRPSSTNNSTFSIWSAKVTKTYLAAPTNIDYDGAKITWKGSSEAKSYEIYVDGILVDSVENQNYYLYDSEEKSFDVTMKSVGDGKEVFSSLVSEESRFVYLAVVTEFKVESGTVSWPAVDDATGYRVKINSSEKTITEPKIENLSAGIDNIIKVLPIANTKGVKYFSNWSAEQKIHILAAPTVSWDSNLAHDGIKMNSFHWESVTGVENYEILLVTPSGKPESITASKYDDSFSYDYLETGEYSVSIKAVPTSGDGFYESAYSKAIKVIRLAPPTGASTGVVTSNADSPKAEFTIHLAKDSKAKGYDVYLEGNRVIQNYADSTITVSNIVNDKNVTTAQMFTYSVQAVANTVETMKDGQIVATLSSLSEKNLKIDITILAVPENLMIEGKVLSWSSVQGAFGYRLVGFNAAPNSASYDLSGIKEPGTYPVQVFARGDGARVLSSPLSSTMNIRKLEAPTNLHVGTSGESEGKIEFDEIAGAKTYQYCLNGNPEYVNQDEFDHVNKYVTEASVSIRVRAIADAFDDAGQVYCISSEFSSNLTLTKLAKPYFNQKMPHDETHLIWTGSTNITAATPGYYVYQGNGLAYQGIYNSTQFSLESFDPGTYTFSVKAVGDGRTTINSDLSEYVTITKLAKPDVEVDWKNNIYTWNFVSDAQKYVVRVDGRLVDTIDGATGTTFTFKPTMETFENRPGTQKVTVVAVSDQHVDSSPTVIEQVIKELSDPTFTISYSHDSYRPDGKIIVTAASTDPNTNAFVFKVDGITSEPQTESVYKHNATYTGEFSVSVIAVGGTFDSNGIFYINSAGVSIKTVRILGAPAKSSITLSNQGILSWNPVDKATRGYEVVVTYDDGTEKTFIVDQPKCIIENFNEKVSMDYNFKIRARGNGTTLIASEYTEWDQSMN